MAFLERHDELLADVIWWIKGYQNGCFQGNETSDLHAGHIEALREARIALGLKRPVDHRPTEEIPF